MAVSHWQWPWSVVSSISSFPLCVNNKLYRWKKKWKKCASGRGIAAKCCFRAPPKKAQLRAPLSPLQTAWTGFDPNLYSSGSSSAGPTLVEIATARSFILNRGIVTDTMTATPLEPGWWAVHSTPLRLLSARSVPCGRAYRPVGIDCKGTMP